jgi:hypothetical protein
MKLPHCENAEVPQRKLLDYLLDEAHPFGSAKARFFRALGFDEENIDSFQRALLSLASSAEVPDCVESPFGTKYVIDGSLTAPGGELVGVRTVWIIESGSVRPRFVTA